MRKLKIGTRGSALAVAQARLVQEAFMKQGVESDWSSSARAAMPISPHRSLKSGAGRSPMSFQR